MFSTFVGLGRFINCQRPDYGGTVNCSLLVCPRSTYRASHTASPCGILVYPTG